MKIPDFIENDWFLGDEKSFNTPINDKKELSECSRDEIKELIECIFQFRYQSSGAGDIYWIFYDGKGEEKAELSPERILYYLDNNKLITVIEMVIDEEGLHKSRSLPKDIYLRKSNHLVKFFKDRVVTNWNNLSSKWS